jgi:hypothetical protein
VFADDKLRRVQRLPREANYPHGSQKVTLQQLVAVLRHAHDRYPDLLGRDMRHVALKFCSTRCQFLCALIWRSGEDLLLHHIPASLLVPGCTQTPWHEWRAPAQHTLAGKVTLLGSPWKDVSRWTTCPE